MIQILPKPTLTTLSINRNQLSLNTDPVIYRVPVDSVLSWISIGSVAAVNGALSAVTSAVYIDQQLFSAGAIPSSNLIWRQSYSATLATVSESVFSDAVFLDLKNAFVKANTALSLQVIGSGPNFDADITVVLATYSVTELRQYSTSNPLLK